MRLVSRRSDDADLIRARLRALLHDSRTAGWVPDEPTDRPPQVEEDLLGAAVDVELPSGIGRHRAPGSTVRVNPGRRGAWSLWAAGVLAALLVAIGTWLDRPQVEPAPVQPVEPSSSVASAPATPSVGVAADTASTVVVAVVGLVGRPGLVTLHEGARVADAIAAAGGLLPEADPASVNLAAVVADGQQVAVGVPGVTPGGAAPAVATVAALVVRRGRSTVAVVLLGVLAALAVTAAIAAVRAAARAASPLAEVAEDRRTVLLELELDGDPRPVARAGPPRVVVEATVTAFQDGVTRTRVDDAVLLFAPAELVV